MATVRISARPRSQSWPKRPAVQTLHVLVEYEGGENHNIRNTTHYLRDNDLAYVSGGNGGTWVKHADILSEIKGASKVHVTAAAKKMLREHAVELPLEVLVFVTTGQEHSSATHFAAALARRGIAL